MISSPAAALASAKFPIQSLGSRGVDVVALQHLLRHHGARLEVSGFVDGRTRDALAAFQGKHGLKPDGVARPQTWQSLVPNLQMGARGDAVLALKQQLDAKRGTGLPANDRFDEPTRDALTAFQQRMRLRQTGTADETTWRHLLWSFTRPDFSDALCGYSLHGGPSRQWGTAGAIGQISAAAELFHRRTGQRVAVGDISAERGGTISGHRTHRVGLDVDIRPARKDGRSCRAGIAYTMRSYDRELTRELIRTIHEAAPGHVRLIYFNDPVLVREGLTTRYPHHDAHLHIRYCEADHPSAKYRCAAAATQDAGVLADALARPGRPSHGGHFFLLVAEDLPTTHVGVLHAAGGGPASGRPASWFGRCSAAGCAWAN